MKKYGVSIPIAGYAYIEVEAENKEEAIDKVFEEGFEDDDVSELEMYERLVEGNICNSYHTRVTAQEIEE